MSARSRALRRGPVAVLLRMRAAWVRIAPFLGIGRLQLVLLASGSVLAGLAEASVLALIASIATALSSGADRVEVDLGPLVIDRGLGSVFVLAFGLALVRAALHIVMAYAPAKMSTDAFASLRRRLFDAFTDTAWSVQASQRDGHFQALMSSHISSASQAVIHLGKALSSFFLFLTLLVGALVLSLPTALVLVVLSSSLFFVMRPLSRYTRHYASRLSEETTEYSKGMQEVVRLAEERQVFGATPEYRRGFEKLIEQVRHPMVRSRFLSGLVTVLYQSVALVVLLLALLLISQIDVARLASLGAVVLILLRSLSYGQQLQASLNRMYELAPYLEKVRDGIDHYRVNPRQDGSLTMPAVRSVGMRDVHFAYSPGNEVLDGLEFEVHAGEAIGIVGPSGAGKSTLVQLLLRLRDPDRGMLHVNGVDARSIRREEWQRKVAYVPQSPQLMWGTVAENIRFHRSEISDEDVERAARLARIHDDVLTWPEGYETVVGERASAVSGGQRQRLCLARALAGRPAVLILDEPTSALDVRSEGLIQDSLRSLKGEVLQFMVAHRLSTLSICDRVMVIVNGKLESIDTPSRLSAENAFFREAIEITKKQSAV